MKIAPHLLIYISGHGYGHVAQVAPVLNALSALISDLRITLRTAVPKSFLQSRIQSAFQYLPYEADFGMCMVSPFEVDVTASMGAYAAFHQHWEEKVVAESVVINKLVPDLVLSDVAYLPLASAAKSGVPAIAMCSLNWADIFEHYCSEMPGAVKILQQIKMAYAQAEPFLRLLPAMPMPWLQNKRDMLTVAETGKNRRTEIIRLVNGINKTRLILVSMGGIATCLNLQSWPRVDGVRWLVARDYLAQIQREDMLAFDDLNMSFSDVLASVDVLLTKPGYGAFTEAACNGIPVLYVRRDDWPEQPYLEDWLDQYGICRSLTYVQMQTGDFEEPLRSLLARGKYTALEPAGKMQVAEFIVQKLEKKLVNQSFSSALSISMASP